MNQDYKSSRNMLLRKYPLIKAKHARKIILFLLVLISAETLIAIFSWQGIKVTPAAPYIGISVGIGVFVLFLFRFLKTNTPIYGTVTDTKRVIHGVHRNGGGVVRYAMDMKEQEFTVFSVTSPNGKIQELEMETSYEKVFKKGDKIIRLSGMKHPVDLTPEEILICPFCGNVFPTENALCAECGEPAIRAKITTDIIPN